jgi:hypothetical protein
MPKKNPPKIKLTIRAFEAIQRAELGGSPLANQAGIEHGTPMLIVHQRDLVAFLKRVQKVATGNLAGEVKGLLGEWDKFVQTVSPEEHAP